MILKFTNFIYNSGRLNILPKIHFLKEGELSMPKVFISYSWEGPEHKSWVRSLSERLRFDGVEAILDQWHVAPGDQLPEFMEKAIRENDFVLIVCTPNYKVKSDTRTGGVGYEGDIMTSEVLTQRNHKKFIPLLRQGEWVEAAPTWLSGKYYIDLRGVKYSEESYQDLIETIHNTRTQAPPVGSPPKGRLQGYSKRQDNVTAKNDCSFDEPIKILEVIADEVTLPRNDRTRGSALYAIPFRLSHRPSDIWNAVFIETWNHPPSWTSMHRSGIARVHGDRIVLDGTTIEEVEKYHRDTLKSVINRTNEIVSTREKEIRRKAEAEKERIKNHDNKVREISHRIKFN